jgi:hypothetical protein
LYFVQFFTGFGVLALLAFPLLLGLAIPYVLLRLQDARSEQPDESLGLKVLLHFVFSLGVLIALAGLTVLVVDLLEHNEWVGGRSSQEFWGPGGQPPHRSSSGDWRLAQRNGGALLIAGLVICLTHVILLLLLTNDLRRPGTRRLFLGWRLAIHSIVTVAAFTMLVVLLCQANVNENSLRVPIAALLVWVPSWLVHVILLRTASRGGPIFRPRPLEVSLPA